MDLFIAGCQGLGLALAVGALLGAPALRGVPGNIAVLAAVIIGAFLFGASLGADDHSNWPGWVIGIPAAMLAYSVSHSVSEGARSRAKAEGAGITVYIGMVAILLAGLCLLPISPISILALIGLVALALAQRKRAAGKHAGLRSLR